MILSRSFRRRRSGVGRTSRGEFRVIRINGRIFETENWHTGPTVGMSPSATIR
jgi:hypothetical protein